MEWVAAVYSPKTSTTGGNITHTAGYDGNGNMTSRSVTTSTPSPVTTSYAQTFEWENLLVKVVAGSQTTQFCYDASGQRTTTIEPSGTTTYTPFPGVEREGSNIFLCWRGRLLPFPPAREPQAPLLITTCSMTIWAVPAR